MKNKPTVEYRWEAYHPTGVGEHIDALTVFKRGPIRTDIDKVSKYANELVNEIMDLEDPQTVTTGRHLAPYWKGARIRVLERSISPWTEMEDWEA